MIELQHISYRIGSHTILDDVCLNIPSGGITALIGPNGAGKSTLLSLMARMQPLQSGHICYDGLNLVETPTATLAQKLAILTQENSIHSRISVRDLLMFGRYPYHRGRPKQQDRDIVEEALQTFQLQPFAERYITALSGGQRQRAMIAMVFCQQTDYVLLDEPLNNLDMFHARELMKLLRQLTEAQGRTMIVVLHDINMAAAYADNIVAMKNGRVLLNGSSAEVINEANIEQLFGCQTKVMDYEGHKLVVHHI